MIRRKLLGCTLVTGAMFLGLTQPAAAKGFWDKLANFLSAAAPIVSGAGSPIGGAACALGEAAIHAFAMVGPNPTPTNNFNVVAASNVGPAYAFTGLPVTDPVLKDHGDNLASLFAAQYGHGKALQKTLNAYYGAKLAGDPMAADLQTVLEAGARDAFGAPFEAATPGSELATFVGFFGGSKGFDDPATDIDFAHSFVDLPAGITAGTLEILMRADGDAGNDTINLQVLASGFGMVWGGRIGSQFDGLTGILPTLWGNGSEATIILDLAALPNADGTTTDLLSYLNTDGRLDIQVSDDTTVDYVSADLVYADPAQAGMTYSEIQAEKAIELVGEMSWGAQAIADTLESVQQFPGLASASVSNADMDAFQTGLVTTGLPQLELSILQEMNVAPSDIAIILASEIETGSEIEPFVTPVTVGEALDGIVSAIRSGEALNVVASLPADFPLSNQDGPVVCDGASHLGFGGANLACDPSGLVVNTLGGQGGIVIENPTAAPTYSMSVQLGGLDSSALPYQSKIKVSTTYQTGADSFPVTASITKVADSEFELITDLSGLGATTKTIEAYNGGQLVAQVTGVPVGVKDGGCFPLPPVFGPKSSSGWFIPDPQMCGEYCWSWPTLAIVTLDGVGTVQADMINVIPEDAAPAPLLFVEEVTLDVLKVASFTVEAVSFGEIAPTCQESLGYASDPTARISVCGGDLSTGTTADLKLYGAPAFGSTLLFVGLTSQPTPVFELSGATLVPIPALFVLALPTDGNGGHTLPIPGGGGPFTVFMQEVILGPNTVTNAVEVQILP